MHTPGRAKMGQMPKDTARKSDYLSYLLRLWQEADEAVEIDDGPVWRASLTSPTTGKRVGFASLEGLVAYLEERMGTGPDSEKARHPSGRKPEDRG
jgi:hypothetical protein